MQLLPNISIRKGSQTFKFGQLIEYNMRSLFLENSFTKFGGESIPRPFSKISKLRKSQGQWSKSLYCLFLLYAKLKVMEIY